MLSFPNKILPIKKNVTPTPPPSMNWPQSLLVSILSGLLGLIFGGLIGIACVKWFRITSFEGASGYAVVGMAIVGALVASVVGLVAARWSDPTFGTGLLRATISVGVTALLIAGVCRLFADPLAFEKEKPAAPVEVIVEDRFALPAANAPLSAWLAVISYGAPEDTMNAVISAVSQRPDFLEEAKQIISGEDDYLALAAFRMMAAHPAPTPAWNHLVSDAGKVLAGRLRSAIPSPPGSDPTFQEVANFSIRFFGWVDAAEALRKRNRGNCIPELKAILELAEPVTESLVLQNDVCRVARHHLKEWSGSEN